MAKVEMKVSGVTERITSTITAGTHVFVIDEPKSQGGNDNGPNPLETVLGALIGCENIIANAVAKEIDFDLKGLSFNVKGELDTSGLRGDPNVRTYFQTVEISVEVRTSESEGRVQELQKITDSRCPVFNMLKAADVDITTKWKKTV